MSAALFSLNDLHYHHCYQNHHYPQHRGKENQRSRLPSHPCTGLQHLGKSLPALPAAVVLCNLACGQASRVPRHIAILHTHTRDKRGEEMIQMKPEGHCCHLSAGCPPAQKPAGQSLSSCRRCSAEHQSVDLGTATLPALQRWAPICRSGHSHTAGVAALGTNL